MRNPRLLITAIGLLLLGLIGNHYLQRPAKPQFAPSLSAPGAPAASDAKASGSTHDALPSFLPREARDTIALIQRGGPYPHAQDGSTFGNREQQLPQRPRGYYREYTVRTPGASNRGARRIITGGDPPDGWYYTSDHYASFRSFSVPARETTR
ncbi:ribonuclease domain-containing protein [Stenotrophomonas sp. CFBP 13718]|uniref:ribonuclease domain-containing protein n=1 Tax=Stenotrophomonas sp. CFBP 13718 TaxID=2775304 RepID=UPI00177F487B|nr:ribonuclease domain-containing protein [Stenotrophomonas sp. CFBP 13718]MBD8696424.1 ribonuclease [Stenotrophomonas sp. CFBP 13718]